MGVVHQFQDAFTIAIDTQKKLFSLSGQRCKHHFAGCIEVVFVCNVFNVSLRSIGFLDDSHLQLPCKIKERVAHLLHGRSLFEPCFHLLRVLPQLSLEVTIERSVLLGSIGRGTVQAIFHD